MSSTSPNFKSFTNLNTLNTSINTKKSMFNTLLPPTVSTGSKHANNNAPAAMKADRLSRQLQ